MDNDILIQDLSIRTDAPHYLLNAIDTRWEKYQSELERGRNEFSNESIRSLRVATRRLLALVQLLRMLNPSPRLQILSRTLKDQLDGFDDLRDTQVMLAEISETIQAIPSLLPFQEFLQKRERRLLRSVEKKFKHIQASDTAKQILKTRKSLEERTMKNFPIRILQVADDAFLNAQQKLGWVSASDSATIHNVRLAFKKFRYLVEIIHPTLGNFPQENIKLMKDYQRGMGRIQDANILLLTLADFAASDSSFDLGLSRRFYEQRHTDAISAYLADMRTLNIFWRAAPDQPFAWEIHQ